MTICGLTQIQVSRWTSFILIRRGLRNSSSAFITQHQPSGGYTTSFWRTVQRSRILQDPSGWFAKLQIWSKQDYPEALRRNIITFNHPVLRNLMPSYRNVLKKSVERGDVVSVHSHTEYFFKSYFDILFSLNRVLHPGEKTTAHLCARAAL